MCFFLFGPLLLRYRIYIIGNCCQRLRFILPCVKENGYDNNETTIRLAERFLRYFDTEHMSQYDKRPRKGRRDKRNIHYATEGEFGDVNSIAARRTSDILVPDFTFRETLFDSLDIETLIEKAKEILSKPREALVVGDKEASTAMLRYMRLENLIRSLRTIPTELSGDGRYVVGADGQAP